MYDLETLARLNRGEPEPELPGHRLRFHPRIVALRQQVTRLQLAHDYRCWLIRALNHYADQIVDRDPHAGWDDLEALQQVALGDAMESSLKHMFR